MKRIAIVGAGHRCYYMFARRLAQNYKDTVLIVGVCDTNIKRCEYFRDTLDKNIKVYVAKEFDKMLDETKPDTVLVATSDRYHHEYAIRAMEKGCDVVSEKPITIDEEKCLAIRQAEKATGKSVSVTFNCRFMPYFAKLKQLLASGVIGKPLAINYEYVLRTRHGGDYFKRWHRFMENSGGMMVHKSTHHFDVINWVLDDEPVSVSAQGARLYFGDETKPHGENCRTCKHVSKCTAFEDFVQNDGVKNLYFEAEKEDGYIRDHCAFKSDTDIYDSMSVSVAYKKGTLLTYSLNLFNTNEGYNIHIIGEKGRLEMSTLWGGDMNRFLLYFRDGSQQEISFPKAMGPHEGGDDRLIAMLFGGVTDDPLGQCSDSFDGVKSAMIGIAANKSMKEGIRVELTPILDKMR